MTALVIGEALVDEVRRYDGTTVERPGGSPMNVAVGLHRLGVPTTLLTSYGDDPRGLALDAHLAGVRVVRHPAPTSVARATLDASGAAAYAFSLGWDLGDGPWETGAPELLHVGSIAATLLPGADAVLRLVEEHPGWVSYDPNCRPVLMGEPAAVLPRVERLVAGSDVVKLSDEDAGWLFPGRPLADLAQDWLARGPALVVVTRGAEGADAWTADDHLHVDAPAGGAVVDTVGAGDAFMAGLLRARLVGLAVAEAVAFAATVARRTCEREGADPPLLVEVSHTG